MSFTYKAPPISPFTSGTQNTIVPVDEKQAQAAMEQMGPQAQLRPRGTSSKFFASRMMKDPTGKPVMTPDQNKPIGTLPDGSKTVGGMGKPGLGGVSRMPNAAAPGFGGYRGLQQGAPIDATTTPGGVVPESGPLTPDRGPLTPNYGLWGKRKSPQQV